MSYQYSHKLRSYTGSTVHVTSDGKGTWMIKVKEKANESSQNRSYAGSYFSYIVSETMCLYTLELVDVRLSVE